MLSCCLKYLKDEIFHIMESIGISSNEPYGVIGGLYFGSVY